jgi:hypothetical protein
MNTVDRDPQATEAPDHAQTAVMHHVVVELQDDRGSCHIHTSEAIVERHKLTHPRSQ